MSQAAPVPSVVDHSVHSRYSDPGRHAAALRAIPAEIPDVSAVARNVIVHYRASGRELPTSTDQDIHSRWLSVILDRDAERHPAPLTAAREPVERVQGCCRDHTLLSVGVLRQHGIPARSRIGFASYFSPTWNHDHVIVEMWNGARWLRFDPEVAEPSAALPTPLDIPAGPAAPFRTAAEVWQGHRDGSLDVETFGVDESVPVIRGRWFVRDYVIREVAHRFGDELLLWDNWGAMTGPEDDSADGGAVDVLIDEVAALLVAADAGDLAAERGLLRRYRDDERLRPGAKVLRADPRGPDLIEVML
ncbi:transglutaminase domain-containing protein [Nakamurella lactea]|uniref:transglutaminase domain-containing protein n=1 Tax=Nakamurella lactea TaxID=459515 RepID=UPI0005661170|nr:transglutaminase domain-containing protein [Nakamurella lactea]